MTLYDFDNTPPRYEAGTSVPVFARDRLPRLSVIIVSGALSVAGTSSAQPNRVWEAPYIQEYEVTASGKAESATEDPERQREATGHAVAELRRISGLTWEQLGQLFGVSRRSVHFWASGKPLNAENESRLLQVLDVIRAADRGDARATRSALLDVQAGRSAFDLLSAERFGEARARLGAGSGGRRPVLGELGPEAKAARAPSRPEELIDARHERGHRAPGRARAARSVRTSRRGSP